MKPDADLPSDVQETTEGLWITRPRTQRRANGGLLMGLSLLFGAITAASVVGSPVDWHGVIIGVLGMVVLSVWAGWWWFTWPEIRVLPAERVVVHRRCWQKGCFREARLPFGQLKAVQAVAREDDDGGAYGELRFVRKDGRVWARWSFESAHQARKVRARVLELLTQESVE